MNVLLAVTGSSSLYRAVPLAISLRSRGDINLKIVMSKTAEELMHPAMFKSNVATEVFTEDDWKNGKIGNLHKNLAEWADYLIIYPATANTVGKIAAGISDTLLTATAMSFIGSLNGASSRGKKMAVCPSFDDITASNPIIESNINIIESMGKPGSIQIVQGDSLGDMLSPKKTILEIFK